MEADYYIAAGDQVTWSKGIERCGEILRARGDKVYVLPGNHESAEQVAGMCARHGLHDFHERHFQAGRWHVAGLGYSNPTPFNTPGEYSEPQIADRLARFAELDPLVLVCHAPPYGTPLDQIRPGPARRLALHRRVHRAPPARLVLLPGTSTKPKASRSEIGRTHARSVGKTGLFARIGLNLHDIRRIGTLLPAPPRPGPGRAEVSLTLPLKSRN